MNESHNGKVVLTSYAVLLLIALTFFCYSPLLGFYVPIFLLVAGVGYEKPVRFLLTSIAIAGASFTFSSRNYVSGTIKDDFANVYLPAFHDVTNGGTVFYDQFSGGVEFFITLYFKFLNSALGITQPYLIMLSVVFLVLVLFYIWLEIFILKTIKPQYRSLCVAACLSLMAIIIVTQNMRQAISCVFLLYAINLYLNKRRLAFLLFWCLAIVSHTSAIITLPIFILIMNGSEKIRLVMVAICLAFLIIFNVAIAFLISHNLLGSSTYKLLYYSDLSGRSVDIGYLKFLIISVVAAYFLFEKNNPIVEKYKKLLFYGTAMYAILMPIPTLPFRMLMLLVVFYNGILMFFSFSRSMITFACILFLYNAYRFLTLGPYQTIIDGPEAYMNLWYSYNWIGNSFLYFIK